MAAPTGPRKVRAYSEEFKVRAVLLCLEPGVLTQDVAASLDIHPFMLSRWKKEFREGKYIVDTQLLLDEDAAAELKRLKAVEKAYKRLQIEHDLFKKPSGSLPNKGKDLRLHPSHSSGRPASEGRMRALRCLA